MKNYLNRSKMIFKINGKLNAKIENDIKLNEEIL